DPLRWGYLVCIIEKESGSILDLFASVANRKSTVDQIRAAEPMGAQAKENQILLPMLRLE
ncbi:MAG: hypothetical protein HYY63_02975, partial [Elusimicrobia bacterium]|nr:hypothetical protein [Elusimicrobiota bacterium]